MGPTPGWTRITEWFGRGVALRQCVVPFPSDDLVVERVQRWCIQTRLDMYN